MKQGGRPRREEEQPDSSFGEEFKAHLRRVKNLTQKVVARETGIPEKTLSAMVKGKRTSGRDFRRDLRDIIRVLYQKKALETLDEANHLITTIPAVSALDERDPDDAAIIALFNTPAIQEEQAINQNKDEGPGSNAETSSGSQDEVAAFHAIPESAMTPPSTLFSLIAEANEIRASPTIPGLASMPPLTQLPPISERTARAHRETKKRLRWSRVAVLVTIVTVAGVVLSVATLSFWRKGSDCPDNTNGVTLYTDIHYQGHCATFGPGEYELALSGLEQNVSSIKNPRNAYFVKLYDKDKNFYNLDTDMPALPAEWDNRADTIHIEKHRPTTCHPGTDGIIAFINTDYSGGCLFITENISDLTPRDFDQAIVSIQFVGSYQNTRQLVLYKRPNYTDECGAYWQNQSDLLQCARNALSVRVLPFTPPTPIPTVAGTRAAGNVVSQASLSPGSAGAAVDGSLQTEWVGGHQKELDLSWTFPVTIERVVVWDRKQSPSDNNQINTLKLTFSDGTSTGSLEMVSQGPRCVDVTFPEKTVTWLHIIPVDASGNNGYREVEVWAITGPQYSNNTCVNEKQVSQTIPQTS